MARFSIWQISDQQPVRLRESSVGFEKKLEDWIEKDPALVQAGLVIIARQIHLEGGILDLLGLDPQGRLVLIEIKANALQPEVIGQAMYYKTVLEEMPYDELKQKTDKYLTIQGKTLHALLHERNIDPEDDWQEREVFVHLVGTGRTAGLDRVVQMLSERYEVPIAVTAFEVFELQTGERVLTREISAQDFTPAIQGKRRKLHQPTIEELFAAAKKKGLEEPLRKFYDHAVELGFHTRLYANSIMFTPQQNKTRMLITIWVKGGPKDQFKAWVSPEAFAEFFNISEEDATRLVGQSGWRQMDAADLARFADGLDLIFGEQGEG